jgi:hypothetical protein
MRDERQDGSGLRNSGPVGGAAGGVCHDDGGLALAERGETMVDDMGPLLRARLAAEKANPRPGSIIRAERAIVRALVAEGFGPQSQVTRHDRFDIAVDDLLIRVEHRPDEGGDASDEGPAGERR